jgi:hypothetical protein
VAESLAVVPVVPQEAGPLSRAALPDDCWRERAQDEQALPWDDSSPDEDWAVPQAHDSLLDLAVRAQDAQALRPDDSFPDVCSAAPPSADSAREQVDFQVDLQVRELPVGRDALHSLAERADLAAPRSWEDVPCSAWRVLPEVQPLPLDVPLRLLAEEQALPLRFSAMAVPGALPAPAVASRTAPAEAAEFFSQPLCDSRQPEAARPHDPR